MLFCSPSDLEIVVLEYIPSTPPYNAWCRQVYCTTNKHTGVKTAVSDFVKDSDMYGN
jgi:hypothetical protein